MNVASFEPCRELYEPSGWDDTSYEYYHSEYPNRMDIVALRGTVPDVLSICPAYSLGYLLRKLPAILGRYEDFNLRFDMWEDSANAGYYPFNNGTINKTSLSHLFFASADTPEDAACRLAIALFNQHILQREGKS